MNDHEQSGKGQDDALSLPALRRIEVDVDRYQALLDDPALSAQDKEQIITALWQIIIAFVDLGFGVHPVQQACGKEYKSEDQSSIRDKDAVE